MTGTSKKKAARKIDENKAINIFLKINNHNWDYGTEVLERLIKRKDCDRGAVLLMYWRTDPHYYLKFNKQSETSDKENWRFIDVLQQALLSGKHPTLIKFDPSDEIAQSSPKKAENYVRELPSEVYEVSPGKIDAQDIFDGLIGPRALNIAAKNNDVKTLKKLINEGKDVDFKYEQRTPLTTAIQAGSIEAIKFLIKQGADIHKRVDGYPPIHLAILIPVVKVLLDAGAKVDELDVHKQTALHKAAREKWTPGQDELVKALIRAGAKPNLKAPNSVTALHMAAWGGNVNSFVHLVEGGWDIQALDRNKQSVLNYSVKVNYLDPPLASRAAMFEEIINQGIPTEAMQTYCSTPESLLENSNFEKNAKLRIRKILDDSQ